MRFLHLIKPVMCVLPEVATPERKVPFREKMLWTAVTLFIFLHCFSNPGSDGFSRWPSANGAQSAAGRGAQPAVKLRGPVVPAAPLSR